MKKRSALARAFTILGLLLAVAAIAPPVMAASGSPLSIKSMKLSVWPEYDDSRVLVIYQGEFNDSSAFPQPVEFPVPLGSEINQVCALKPPNSEHLCQLYDTLTGPDNLTVAYTLPIPTYYLEYYWDGVKGPPDKSFTFKYASPYAVDTLEVEVQQPLKATGFKLTPPYASVNSDGLGMKYYHYVFNNVTPGQVISIDAAYTKPDNEPSVAKGKGTGEGTGGGTSGYVIMGFGAAALVVTVIGFMALRRKPLPARPAQTAPSRASGVMARRVEGQRGHTPPASRPARPERGRAAPVAAAGQPGGEAAFCNQCGTRLPPGARFCHVCGAKTEAA